MAQWDGGGGRSTDARYIKEEIDRRHDFGDPGQFRSKHESIQLSA
jgi:hypothetical protein